MAERTIIINGFSKSYAMTGWRLAWLAAPLPVAKLARTYQTQTVTSAASFSMVAGAAALTDRRTVFMRWWPPMPSGAISSSTRW